MCWPMRLHLDRELLEHELSAARRTRGFLSPYWQQTRLEGLCKVFCARCRGNGMVGFPAFVKVAYYQHYGILILCSKFMAFSCMVFQSWLLAHFLVTNGI